MLMDRDPDDLGQGCLDHAADLRATGRGGCEGAVGTADRWPTIRSLPGAPPAQFNEGGDRSVGGRSGRGMSADREHRPSDISSGRL
jgi:hypothetical protein